MSEQGRFFCSVFRSGRKEGMYLFVRRGQVLDDLPAPLMKAFGRAEHSMDLLLRPGIKLARVSVEDVMEAIEEQGFYLQMPPADPDADLYLKGRNPHA